MPPPPGFRGRSFPLARFGVVGRSRAIVGLFRTPCTCPDLGTFFRENAFQHIFPEKCVPNRFWHTEGNSPSTASGATNPKTSEWQRAAIKTRVQGLPLVFFPPTFFKESRAPRRSRRGTHVAGSTLQRFQRNRLPMTEDPCRAGGPLGASPAPSLPCGERLSFPRAFWYNRGASTQPFEVISP